jgi:O-antigen/teichoic acid export membrane protein
MQQIFLRGLFITLVLNLLVKPATIFYVDIVMQNELKNDIYGKYQVFLNTTFLFSMLLDMGITNFMTRLIAQHPHLIRQYSNQLFTLRLALALLYTVWTCILFLVLGFPLSDGWILGALILHQININTVNYVRAYTGGLLRFGMDAVLSVMERSIYLILGCLVLYTSLVQRLSLEMFIGIFVGSSFISLIFAVFVYISIAGMPKWKWNTVFFRAIFRKSLPYALLVILMMLYMRLDAVLLDLLNKDGKEQVGYYTQGFRLLDACYMFGILFGSLLLPVFSRQLKEKGSVSGIMTSAINILIGGGILMVALTFGIVHKLFDALYDDTAQVSYHAWFFLALSFLPMCFTIVFGTLLTANGSMRILNIISACGLCITIVVNCLLAPELGALGTAIATFCTHSVVGVMQWFVVRNRMKQGLLPMTWTKLAALGVLMAGLLFLQLVYKLEMFWWALLSCSVWAILIFGLRIIDIRAILSLLNKTEEAVLPEE